MIEFKLKTDYIKVQDLLKVLNLVYSGGEAKQVILEGLVIVNKSLCRERGKKLRQGDRVNFLDEEIIII